MPLNLFAALAHIYPEAPPHRHFATDNPWDIRDDGDGPFISEWRYHKPQPNEMQLSTAAAAAEVAQQQAQANAEARAYLASTDWYVIRMLEGGPAIPDDVVDARAAARLAVVE